MDDRSDRRDRPVGTPDDHFVWPPPIDAGDAGTDSEPQASSDEDLPEAYLPPPPPPAGALWPGYLDALPPAEISEPIRDVKAPEVAVADVAEGFPDAPSVIGASPSVIGRAAVRTASAERDEVQAWRSSGRTYRAGIAPADPPAAAAMPAPPAAAAMPAPPAAAAMPAPP
ncbi:MAG TPA: hypothetical protein VFC00_38460, partial [Micromonosporaceae bacterium]|nr:hypothetical protein [Micromonosporaceae bacterium]